ncbi:hypothetical protein HZB03_04815 [Candidatus Woesearchaeota archaeon]|nr:hypothetical protein [Candidatus Woesearchaeota archaeon]
MVWARTKLLIWDYIFEPVKDLRIDIMGKTPEKFYPKINEQVRSIFNIPDAYVQEKKYKWEKGKDMESFEVEWEVTKVFDIFSYITVVIELKGFTINGEGKATIRLKPRLITEYPQDTIWQQNILYEMLRRFWHEAFYQKKRMEYLNTGKELLVSFEQSLKKYGQELNKG